MPVSTQACTGLTPYEMNESKTDFERVLYIEGLPQNYNMSISDELQISHIVSDLTH